MTIGCFSRTREYDPGVDATPEEADRKDARGVTATRRGAGSWWKWSVGGVSRMAGLHPVDRSLCVLVGVISVGWFQFYKLWRKIRQQMYRDAS